MTTFSASDGNTKPHSGEGNQSDSGSKDFGTGPVINSKSAGVVRAMPGQWMLC